jgi:hypothetical protein
MTKYDVSIKVHMPGMQKESVYHILVEAENLPGAIEQAQLAWIVAVKPRNMSVEELTS